MYTFFNAKLNFKEGHAPTLENGQEQEGHNKAVLGPKKGIKKSDS